MTKKVIRRISLFLLAFVIFFSITGISEATFSGTIGTKFTIMGDGFGSAKPKVYIEYKKRNGAVKQIHAKVEEWSNTSVTCLWTQAAPAGNYNLWVKPNSTKAIPIAQGAFTIMPPVIDNVSPESLTAGATIAVAGRFFTNRKPTVYVLDLTTQRRRSCRVLSSIMDPSTGTSLLRFVVPRLFSGKYEIILKTQVGEASVMPTSPPSSPTGVTATAGIEQVRVDWTEVPRATAYNIYWSNTSGVTKSTGTKLSNVVTPYLHSPLSNGAAYYYVVTAVNKFGEGSESVQVSAIPKFPPVAIFAGPPSALKGQTVTFDASKSSTGNDRIVSYSVDFGDGSPVVTQSEPLFTHVYSTIGIFTISLTVTDNQGLVASVKGDITIGIVLSQPVNISNTITFSQGADFAIDERGTISVVWQENGSEIWFSRSDNGGNTFVCPKPVATRDPYYCMVADQMAIATTNTAIHVAWTFFDTCLGGAEIVYARSADKGNSFSSPSLVSDVDYINSIVPSIATDGIDAVGIVWDDINLYFEYPDAPVGGRYSGSSDNGSSFSVPKPLTSIFDCCADISIYLQNTYIALSQGNLGHAAMFFSRSLDGGTTFSAPARISEFDENTWCPQMRLDSTGNIYITWVAGSALAHTRKVLFSKSTDRGASFSPPSIISPLTSDSYCSSIAVGVDHRVYVVWSTGNLFDNNQSFLSFSSDDGETFSVPLKIPFMSEFTGCPKIIARNLNEISLVWSDSPIEIDTFWHFIPDIFYSNGTVSIP